jgi:hypothetical protein
MTIARWSGGTIGREWAARSGAWPGSGWGYTRPPAAERMERRPPATTGSDSTGSPTASIHQSRRRERR